MTTAATTTPAAATTATGTTPPAQAAAAAPAAAATTTTPQATAGETTTTTPAQASTETQSTQTTETVTAPARVVPESYTLSLPQNTVLDQSDVAEISAMAKQQGLTNDEAQAALGAYEQSLRDQSTKFRSELEADTELGGAHLAQTQRDVLRALDKLVPASTAEGQALRTFLNKSGLGNQAHLVRLLARAGKAMGEDTPVLTSVPRGETQKDIVELFYGKQ
jgi:hypothetical protein